MLRSALFLLGLFSSCIFVHASQRDVSTTSPFRGTLSPTEQEWLRSLYHPSESDRDEVVERVQRLRDLHEEAREVWRKKFKAATVTCVRLVRDASIVAIRRWPAVYRASISMNVDRPPEILAVDLGIVGQQVLDALRAGTCDPELAESPSNWDRGVGKVYFHLLRDEYGAAIEAIHERRFLTTCGSAPPILEELESLAKDPNDLEASLELIAALGDLPTPESYTIARFELAWRCWDRAVDDRMRGRVALLLARIAGPDWQESRSGAKITRTLLIAAVTLLSPFAAPEQLADSSALLADAESYSRHYALAAHLDKQIAYNMPFTRAWARATLNAGHWMRITGNPAEAIYLLELLLPSQVDDEEQGPNILELCMNYRHRAAIEISRCYEDQHLYRRAYDWMGLALSKYTYHSLCGNCTVAANRSILDESTRLARKAGLYAR